jgi:cytochrome c2
MKSADFVWDEAKLNRFIANPDEIVPGKNHSELYRKTIVLMAQRISGG